MAERRGLARLRTEQPTYSILSRGIGTEVLPVAQRYGMGTMVWSPLAKGMLTGRVRKGRQTDLHRAAMFASFSDERRLDAVERLVPLAEAAGLPVTHLAMAFTIAADQSAYRPPAVQRQELRRRPVRERAAA